MRGRSAFGALSMAILRGFLRDRMSVFFSVVFPMMFLVLFGGLFNDPTQPRIRLIEVGPVPLLESLPPDAQAVFDATFKVITATDLDAALAKVRSGDADAVVRMDGDTLQASYTVTDKVKAGTTQGVLGSLVDAANLAATGRPPAYRFSSEQVEDESLKTIQFVTPGLLGWAVAMSATFGAATTLNGWRTTKLLRRLRLAPVSTGTLVAARVVVTVAVALGQMLIFVGVGVALFGLRLSGAWPVAVPLLIAGTLCFMAIGLLVGSVAKSVEGSVAMANFIVLPMAFLSGSFFSLDGAPAWLRGLSKIFPLRWLNVGMLDVMVRGKSAGAILTPLAVLVVFAVAVSALAARIFRWDAN